MGKNKGNDGHQQGASGHAPSQQGAKTRARQKEIAQSGSKRDEKGPRHDPDEIRTHDDKGKDRLFEDREQHDDAEVESEKTRLARDIDRHNHDPDDGPVDREREISAKRKS